MMKNLPVPTVSPPAADALVLPMAPAREAGPAAAEAAMITQWPKTWNNAAPQPTGGPADLPAESKPAPRAPAEAPQDSVIERFADTQGLTCGQARGRLFRAGFPPNRRPFAWCLSRFSGWTRICQQDWALVDAVAGARSPQELRAILNSDRHSSFGGLLGLLDLRISRRLLHRFAHRLLVADNGDRQADGT
jgi:hypothetical protein